LFGGHLVFFGVCRKLLSVLGNHPSRCRAKH